MGPFRKKSIRMKTSQSNIVYTLILSACFLVNKGHAQGTATADSTNPLPIVPFSMTVVFVEFDITAKSNVSNGGDYCRTSWSILYGHYNGRGDRKIY